MKEKIDNFLKKNASDIQLKRSMVGFSWRKICHEIGIEDSLSEYVRGRFKAMKLNKSEMVSTKTFSENIDAKNAEIKDELDKEIKTIDELVEHLNIDTTRWKVSSWRSSRTSTGKFAISASLKAIPGLATEEAKEKFIEWAKTIKPAPASVYKLPKSSRSGCLVLPRQDIHFNKYDIHGENSIEERFKTIELATLDAIKRASATYDLKKIIYIVGSDEFNSEWTTCTTKGTPQQNILSYQDAFEKICSFELRMIEIILSSAEEVEVVFLPGNHDEFVGWHLIHFLQGYFRNVTRLKFNSEIFNTKIIQFKNTLMMFNHGDKIKPRDLAAKFPHIAKEEWSSADFFYIFTGDKHHEFAHDLNGILFYQVPQLSKATSGWDDKMGFTAGAEMITFLIDEESGLSSIFKKPL